MTEFTQERRCADDQVNALRARIERLFRVVDVTANVRQHFGFETAPGNRAHIVKTLG